MGLLFRKRPTNQRYTCPSIFVYRRCQASKAGNFANHLPALFKAQLPNHGDTVFVAMSGGVDSSVAAALLKESPLGLDVHGIFMRNWTDDSKSPGGCSAERDWKDVQQVGKHLEIPVHRVDFSREYWIRVFEPALKHYDMGNTPNPDIACNREIKFGSLIDYIRDIALPKYTKSNVKTSWWLATGHYTRAVIDIRSRKTHLMRAIDFNKDQTYFLSTVEQYALEHCYFPLASYTKPEIREIALSIGLHNAKKSDSQGLCFVSPETNRFRDFLSSYLAPGPVTYVDENGTELMKDNRGLWSSTIGEKSGLQLNQGSPETHGKWFVSAKDHMARRIELVRGSNHPRLFKQGAVSTDWIWADYPGTPDKLLVQLRHRQEPVPCIVHDYGNGNVGLFFQDKQRSVVPGQHLAVYSGNNVCMGGGTILESIEGLDELSRIDWQSEGLNPLGL